MEELKKQILSLRTEIEREADRIDLVGLDQEWDKLNKEAMNDNWSDRSRSETLHKRLHLIETQTKIIRKLVLDIYGISDLAEQEDADSLIDDLRKSTDEIRQTFEEYRKENRFEGPYDDHEVILSIHAGAGGTDAQHWAQMLLRMYVRWSESQKLNVKTVDQAAGEEAGLKSVTIELTGGSYLYGKLAGEHGVHRLVRISPFNSGGSRETSFAKVEILPMINKPDEVQIDDKDLKIDVYRAGGHGGQSVNTTDSAVRVTHLPTGLTVSIQNERSQLQNRETALAILRSRLAALQLEQRAETLADVKGPNQSAEFGNQIRSYVLHPYKQVKDNRTGYESSDVEKVLNGDLDPLITAWLERP